MDAPCRAGLVRLKGRSRLAGPVGVGLGGALPAGTSTGASARTATEARTWARGGASAWTAGGAGTRVGGEGAGAAELVFAAELAQAVEHEADDGHDDEGEQDVADHGQALVDAL